MDESFGKLPAVFLPDEPDPVPLRQNQKRRVALAAAMFFCILPIITYIGAPETLANWLQCLLPGGALGLNNSLLYAMTELDFLHPGGLSVWNVHLMFVIAALWIPVLLIGTVWSYCRRRG